MNGVFLRSTHLTIMAIPYLVENYYEGVHTTNPELSEVYNINPRSLMVSLRRLTQVGVLKSQVGGVYPGFKFAKDPKEISMYDVIVALEGSTRMNECRYATEDVKCKLQDCKKKLQSIQYNKHRYK